MRRGLLAFLGAVLALSGLGGCVAPAPSDSETGLGNGWQPVSSMELTYAKNFAVDFYEDGLALITAFDGGGRILVIPEGGETPSGIASDIIVLHQPITGVYLQSTAVMSLFIALDAVDTIRFSGVAKQSIYLPEIVEEMEAGSILYGGKYNAPDYELILQNAPDLAVESTMLNHSPEVRDKLESVGIPVLIDHSSHEEHPLGRTEWIKVYGVLLGKQQEAERFFEEQIAFLTEVSNEQPTDKTVAFFYISSAGYVVARKSGDYVAKMIELAGGEYIFSNLGDEKATSTVNMEMEQFYADAQNVDFIIYNSSIGGNPGSIDALIALNPLLADFAAVKSGNVWVTSEDFYQNMTGLGMMIVDMHKMLTMDNPTDLAFIERLV